MNQGLKARSIPGWKHPRRRSHVWFVLNMAIVGQPLTVGISEWNKTKHRRCRTSFNFGFRAFLNVSEFRQLEKDVIEVKRMLAALVGS
jgi:hypothetical protein